MGARWTTLLPLVVFAAGVAVVAFFMLSGKDPRRLPSALIDRPAPTFTLPPLGQRKFGLTDKDLVGRVTLVNIFASWCIPCLVEHPQLMRLKREKLVPVYGINYKDDPADAEAWLKRHGNPYTRIGTDRNGRVGIEWGVYGVPETFIIDRQGRIRYKHVGPIMKRDLDEIILPIVRSLGQ